MSNVKITSKDKAEAVERYMRDEGTLRSIADEYGVHHSCLEKWISLYKMFGAEGLERSQVNNKYPIEVKKAAIMSYLEGRTQRTVCEEYKIRSTSVLQAWLMNREKYMGQN